MKNQKILFYLLKWITLIFLAILALNESHSKILMLILIGFISAILIWEGIRDFRTKETNSNN